jgi:hypothetical protein
MNKPFNRGRCNFKPSIVALKKILKMKKAIALSLLFFSVCAFSQNRTLKKGTGSAAGL